LQVRASYLVDHCLEPTLKRFTLAATDSTLADRKWLESLMMILADKPAHTWADDDRAAFELKLSDLAKQFKRLEALQKDMAATQQEGFMAYRLTLTQSDGNELNQMLWIDQDQESQLDELVEGILAQPAVQSALRQNRQLGQGLIAKLAQQFLQSETPDEIGQARRGKSGRGKSGRGKPGKQKQAGE
jgi:hypothetical protein